MQYGKAENRTTEPIQKIVQLHNMSNKNIPSIIHNTNEINEILASASSITLFAMHSNEKHIPDATAAYIHFLSEVSEYVFVLTTNIAHLNDKNMFPKKVIIMPFANKGLDFGLWSQFIYKFQTNLQNGHIKTLALVNDSCICLHSLKTIMDENNSREFWGITESIEYDHHIQSYFMVFNTEAIIQKVLTFFLLHSFHALSDRQKIIHIGEIGLSQFMKLNSIIGHAHYKINNTTLSWKNSAYFYWPTLRERGCPLIKKKRHNL